MVNTEEKKADNDLVQSGDEVNNEYLPQSEGVTLSSEPIFGLISDESGNEVYTVNGEDILEIYSPSENEINYDIKETIVPDVQLQQNDEKIDEVIRTNYLPFNWEVF